MKIIMLGAPGAGKGTQAEKICERYELPHISTGDIFRENIKQGTELGKKAKGYMDAGQLVPDELVCDLVIDRVHQPDTEKGYVLDGFPRTLPQAEVFDKAMADAGEELDAIIDMELPDDDLVIRMTGRRVCPKCGAGYHTQFIPPKKEGICDECGSELITRDDDKIDTFKKRLAVYKEETQPLVGHYKKTGKLHEIDGRTGLEPGFADISGILDKLK